MANRVVTLTSDFGQGSPYVAAMKGALLSVNPQAQVVDLSHALRPQDLGACSFFLRSALQYFPAGTVHVVVVDPGVGTNRPLLCVESAEQLVLAPDNGCWTEWAKVTAAAPRVTTLVDQRYWRTPVSDTFHGRDILAPVAGHLSLGVSPQHLGPPAAHWVQLALPAPTFETKCWKGEVLFVDDFGNLITNLPGEMYRNHLQRIKTVNVGGHLISKNVRTYGEAAKGDMVVLVSSSALVEIAQVCGNAAKTLVASAGTPVVVEF